MLTHPKPTDHEPAQPPTAPPAKIAIIAVHGVLPQPRYAFGDQVASALCGQLNAADATAGRAAAAGRWVKDVVFPRITPPRPADAVGAEQPSIVRIHQSECDALDPVDDYYDVVEAYWSPIDKGKTNAARVFAWLLATLFAPANTTARYRGWPVKAWSDFVYSAAIACLGLVALVVSAVQFANALNAIVRAAPHGATAASAALPPFTAAAPAWLWNGIVNAWQALPTLLDPASLAKLLQPDAAARVGAGLIGGYLVGQAVRAITSVIKQWTALASVRGQFWSRVRFIAALLLGAAALLGWSAATPAATHGRGLGPAALELAIAALAFEFLRMLLQTFVTQFFGDVEIYCTRDENAEFFALRIQILELVERRIVETLKAGYDRVYIFAHSLGSTISLDALMKIYNLRYENGITEHEWRRIRAFVTFGTSLEKTRFFLDAYGVSNSASFEQWRDDYYGSMFSADASVLNESATSFNGIYWANYWYFFDFIADRIASYRSVLKPTEAVSAGSAVRRYLRSQLDAAKAGIPRIVAQNRVSYRLPNVWSVLHGDYLNAAWFWRGDTESTIPLPLKLLGAKPATDRDRAIGALDIVVSRAAAKPGTGDVSNGAPPQRPSGSRDTRVGSGDRFETTIPRSRVPDQNLRDVITAGS